LPERAEVSGLPQKRLAVAAIERDHRDVHRHTEAPARAMAVARAAPTIADSSTSAQTAIENLHHVIGNRAVTAIIQRQRGRGGSPAPALPPPTHDQIAAEMGSALGGPYTDYASYVATMVSGRFLGHTIARGVRQEFLTKLADAETKIADEYTQSGNPVPTGHGISSVGGFRNSAGYHGWGLAIDLDVARNPFVMHESGERDLDRQLAPVYHRVAEFILNSPIGTQQSIIPTLITSGGGLTATSPTGRRDRMAEYYDRLLLESNAMKRYFELMNDPTALVAYLAGPWSQTHPQATPPPAADVTSQMWQDFATLGGAIPRGGPPGVTGFVAPADATGDRPFHPRSAGQQDPGEGFLTIPREVVLGLGRAVSRWGATEFGGESGDIQHFDDGTGLGGTVTAAKAAARAKIAAAATAAAATATPTVAPVRIQRWKEPGEGSDEGGVLSDAGPAELTPAERLSGAHWKQIADDRWGGATAEMSELESSFSTDLQAFIDMLATNGITHQLTAAYRPKERSYLFKYCLDVQNGRIAPKDVPAMAGVDIIWDHGNLAASRSAAKELAEKFGLVGLAAHPSNHNSGKAADMKLDFSGNTDNKITYTVGGRTITRTIKTNDEARVGVSSRGKTISAIGSRELSKAGADFGVKRALDNDIVHWSRSGR
jgi:hypothetical protein